MSDLESLEQSKVAKRFALAQWRAGQRHEMDLQSGLPVILKDATLTDLAFSGRIPETLMAQILSQAEKKQGAVDLKDFSAFKDFGMLMDELVRACLIDPPIADKPDVDHLTLAELSNTDKMFVFNWANREVSAIAAPFRGGQAQPVSAAQPG